MPGEPRGAPLEVDGPTAATAAAEPAFDIGSDEPAARCPYCDRPFRRNRHETLHRGLEHDERLSDSERAELERTRDAEYARIRRVRVYALGVLVLLYFGLLIVAAFVV